ncbi:hypothetical protein HBB16_02935 [Pseudonocardia sp. MCCB 268]|nr:hypothetical protein [Pseudonocardia cytotoxica]
MAALSAQADATARSWRTPSRPGRRDAAVTPYGALTALAYSSGAVLPRCSPRSRAAGTPRTGSGTVWAGRPAVARRRWDRRVFVRVPSDVAGQLECPMITTPARARGWRSSRTTRAGATSTGPAGRPGDLAVPAHRPRVAAGGPRLLRPARQHRRPPGRLRVRRRDLPARRPRSRLAVMTDRSSVSAGRARRARPVPRPHPSVTSARCGRIRTGRASVVGCAAPCTG